MKVGKNLQNILTLSGNADMIKIEVGVCQRIHKTAIISLTKHRIEAGKEA